MRLILQMTCYLAAALVMVSAGLIGLSILATPVDSETAGASSKFTRASGTPKQITIEPRGSSSAAFRYGPVVNHGRSDMPVYVAKQAQKEAKLVAPSRAKKRKQPYQERRIDDPGIAMSFAPSLRSSGH